MEKSKTALADVLEKLMIAADRLEHKDLIFTYGESVYPTTPCTPEKFKAMASSEARRDDVILASIPKSGMFFLLHKGSCHNNADNQNRYNNTNTNNNSNNSNCCYY